MFLYIFFFKYKICFSFGLTMLLFQAAVVMIIFLFECGFFFCTIFSFFFRMIYSWHVYKWQSLFYNIDYKSFQVMNRHRHWKIIFLYHHFFFFLFPFTHCCCFLLLGWQRDSHTKITIIMTLPNAKTFYFLVRSSKFLLTFSFLSINQRVK